MVNKAALIQCGSVSVACGMSNRCCNDVMHYGIDLNV